MGRWDRRRSIHCCWFKRPDCLRDGKIRYQRSDDDDCCSRSYFMDGARVIHRTEISTHHNRSIADWRNGEHDFLGNRKRRQLVLVRNESCQCGSRDESYNDWFAVGHSHDGCGYDISGTEQGVRIMWLHPNLQTIIQDADQYTALNGATYPGNWPK